MIRKRARDSHEDFARYGEDASREVILLKIPEIVKKFWTSSLENGGVESTYTLEPKITLAHSPTLADGTIVTVLDPTTNEELKFKCSLSEVVGKKMRLISSEVSDRAENTKFEGVVRLRGELAPVSLNEEYKNKVRSAFANLDKKETVQTLNEREERELLKKKTGKVLIPVTSRSPADADADDEEEDEDEEEGGTGEAGKKRDEEEGVEKKKGKKPKRRERREKKDWTPEQVKQEILRKFEEKPAWKRKELRQQTGIQFHKMSSVLDELCDYSDRDKAYTLKKRGGD